MQITFLGTSSGVPTRSRNVSSVALRLPQRAELWLFDCGEGTQHQILRSDLKISQLSRIFITHLHGDHIFGLMGLLASCGLAGNVERVDIYGPAGLNEYLQGASRYSHTHFSYPIKVHTVQPGVIYEDEEFTVTCGMLHHRITAFGYRVMEKNRYGRFDVEQAKALQIPSGPIYGKLKRGETVKLEDGRIINGKELCGPTEIGRKFAYCTDTVYCDGAVKLAEDADVLIHEATFAHQDAEMAFQRLHSTSTMAAQTAYVAGVNQLIMTHFSPRYTPGNDIELKDLLKEARAIFPNTIMAHDFMVYDIPRRREKGSGDPD
ncbi:MULTISPECIES: ribonuclease Z [Cylindrospermopsis]|uniref:ribonuclease Z n=1 Tax=Cylindrospermopsis TaxID=77021 RepID=UPI00070CE8FB|nr:MULTISPECIES: ribonuclease Z [Cylindrospermopsis]MBU6345858.1 ribonuclease Z [Cyanobacteria bacterium REEB494]KRH97329.1 ribonuclease Z [Cylindrospermopsis sp. CR12]TPX28114.1 ribonuclease Z [Cylindrospermopsis raciborskii GIHE 2018]UJL34582.1 ribonuclease Z [Cylindrospermopsis raciborskii Cr2010]UJS04102.1 ribonuclease Z [Cylindrospermopsis raciborskii KLL07]